MAMTLTVAAAHDFLDQGLGIASIDAAAVAATSVDLNFINSGNEVLLISAGATGVTATVKAVADPSGRGGGAAGGGGDDNDVATVVPANGVALITFAKPAMFNQTGLASVVLSNITTAKVFLARLRKNG